MSTPKSSIRKKLAERPTLTSTPSPSGIKEKAKSKKKFAGSTSAVPQKQVPVVKPQPQQQSKELPSWDDFVKDTTNVQWVCGVEYFKFAPFGPDKWQSFAKPGMVVEIPNYKKPSTYWPATIVGFAGYDALVEYVKVDEKKSDKYVCWIPFCSNVPKPLGYCFTNKILLRPVSEKDQKDQKFLEKTFNRLVSQNLPTVELKHWETCLNELNSTGARFSCNELVEALDKLDCSRSRMGLITVTLGNRIHIQYFGLSDDDEGFWFSQQSEHVHKMGWSHAVGIEVEGARPELVYPLPIPSEFPAVPKGVKIRKNDMFEMRHPVHLHKICAAYVVKPLRHGYFVAGTDWTREDEYVNIVMHVTSDYVLPINFCNKHGINLDVPKKDAKEMVKFSWRKYLEEVECIPLELSAIKKETPKFTNGCKLEAVDLKEPTRLGPATVIKVCGHLLQIHFDGYPRSDAESFQWVSANSPDIYPACYSKYVGHKLACKPDLPNPVDSFDFAFEGPSAST
ncbi:Lethal(3)malignant brain tumor-like protein 2 [Orchesella cincta]|uniref:Lethal(3)malignant brain tumor-like protein 2 n=1 Tax=Orchesella cincta TaxID=48709 RepID=A0A1D2MDV9_ORCCI|nr:Lethal(3)malignant brain tumor-like protein 2 [Orchesella cincta]